MKQSCFSIVLSTCIFCIAIFGVALIRANDAEEGLPFCGVSQLSNRIVVISTLDGKISALNPEDNGSLLWTVHPGHEPMLSSSIHRLELTNFGQLIRIIPSLNGGLYVFNGETIEPMPLAAENLLHASFRYSEDTVISGGKESQTIGISLLTGEILYECSMRGCSDAKERNIVGDVLLVQRLGQVVRAVKPRTGVERWNFSVAQHDLKLLSECHSPGYNVPRLNLKVVIPDGLVCAMDPADSNTVLWKHKFDFPIVSAWEIQKDNIFEIDLFSLTTSMTDAMPSLYVGMHEKQLYIQESVKMLQTRKALAVDFGQKLIPYEKDAIPRLPWRPVVANAQNTGLESVESEDTALEEAQTTALSVLYASPFVEGRGFFLYTKEEIQSIEGALCNVTIMLAQEDTDDAAETPVTVVIVSLWYWWKEVTIISITTAIGFNLLFTRRYLRLRIASVSENGVNNNSDSGVAVEKLGTNSESQLVGEFNSRYLSEFVPVNCLGKGGFGVVFEAKNKLDDCHYAIKRIVLPDKPHDRERVMREVRALAKMDHHHIVRYFNAWMECPPPGWQQEQDRNFVGDMDSLPSGFYTETTTNCYPSPVSESQSLQLPPSAVNDASDSFIVFEADEENCENKTDALPEHSITIDESNGSAEKKKRRRRRNTLEWSEHSSIWHSPSKVYLYIQMQLCKRESLKVWLQQNPQRDYQSIMSIFAQIVRAVDYVHFHKHIHRDLKPSNILFSMDQQIKVSDFGLVTSILDDGGRQSLPDPECARNGYTSQVGTQLYMSPEQLSGQSYNHKVDIFSLGLILFELLVPFSTEMERLVTLQDIKLGKFPSIFAQKYKQEHDLLKRMLSAKPEERPDTGSLLTLPSLVQTNGDFKGHRRESSMTSQSSYSSSDNFIDET